MKLSILCLISRISVNVNRRNMKNENSLNNLWHDNFQIILHYLLLYTPILHQMVCFALARQSSGQCRFTEHENKEFIIKYYHLSSLIIHNYLLLPLTIHSNFASNRLFCACPTEFWTTRDLGAWKMRTWARCSAGGLMLLSATQRYTPMSSTVTFTIGKVLLWKR